MDQIIQTMNQVAKTQQQIIAGNEQLIANNNRMLDTVQAAIASEKETQRLLDEAFAKLGL